MNPFGGGQVGPSRGNGGVDGDDPRPNEISSSSGGVGVQVDRGGPIITSQGSGVEVDRATVSSMLQELEDKFENRMVEEREARRESEEMLKDCIEKLMEELCQVTLIVTGKREDDEEPARQRENITKRLGKLYRELRVKFGKLKGDDESWETREEMIVGIKRELGLENSENAVQNKRVDVQTPQPVVPAESSSVPDASDVMSTSSKNNGEAGEEGVLNDGDQPSVVRGESVLEGAPDPRLGPPYLRLRRLDPAIFPTKNKNAREENTPAPRGGKTASAHGKPHSTKNQQERTESKVGESRHIQTRQSSSDNWPFQCLRCPARFKFKGDLTQHMVVHSDRKPFKCPKCTARFKSSGSVKAHMLCVHSNRRPFRCHVCGSGFKFNHQLTSHLRVHTGERPYSCEICDKAFTNSSDLKKHARTHLGEEGRIHQCLFCSMKFVQLSTRRNHQQRRHKLELASAAATPEGLKKKGLLKTPQTAKVVDQPKSRGRSTEKE